MVKGISVFTEKRGESTRKREHGATWTLLDSLKSNFSGGICRCFASKERGSILLLIASWSLEFAEVELVNN